MFKNIFPFNINNADFILSTTNSVLADINQRDCPLIFKPFVVDEVDDNKFLLNQSDLDPDINLCMLQRLISGSKSDSFKRNLLSYAMPYLIQFM